MALLRVRAGLGVALCAGACGFDSSGTGSGAAEIGEATADDAPESSASGSSGGDAATTAASAGGTTSTTTGTASAPTDVTGASDPSDTTAADTTGVFEWGPFEDALPITPVNSAGEDDDPTLRDDLLEIVFASTREPATSEDLMVALRADTSEDFGAPDFLPGNINRSDANETTPELSLNGLVMTFSSDRSGGPGGSDLFFTWRNDLDTPWADPVRIDQINSDSNEAALVTTSDALVAYYCWFSPATEEQIVHRIRPAVDQAWSAATELGINSAQSDCSPWVSGAGGELWFNSRRAGGEGETDIWFSVIGKAVGEPTAVEDLNGPSNDEDPWLSSTGDLVVFASNRDGNTDLYWAVRAPL